MKLFMMGLVALVMCGLGGLAHAEEMKVNRGMHCGSVRSYDNELQADIGAGQYVYVQWMDVTNNDDGTTSKNEAEPVFMEDNGQAVGWNGYYDGGWYLFRASYPGSYTIRRYTTDYVPDSSLVRVCFYNFPVGQDDIGVGELQ